MIGMERIDRKHKRWEERMNEPSLKETLDSLIKLSKERNERKRIEKERKRLEKARKALW